MDGAVVVVAAASVAAVNVAPQTVVAPPAVVEAVPARLARDQRTLRSFRPA